MKNPSIRLRVRRMAVLAALLVIAGAGVGCMTAYDAQGRPIQVVDPGMAVAGAAAAGMVGYAIANDNNGYHHRHHHGGYYRH